MKNLHAPIRYVFHSDLTRDSPESPYRSDCPACKTGLLLCPRHPETLKLINADHCITCCQRYVYKDEMIAQEEVQRVAVIPSVEGATPDAAPPSTTWGKLMKPDPF